MEPTQQTVVRRVLLPTRTEPEPTGQKCRLCDEPNPPGRRRCIVCNADLQPPKPRPSTVGQFTSEVVHGEDMQSVSAYLHRQGYLTGPTPGQFHAVMRKRGRRRAEQAEKRLRQREARRTRAGDPEDNSSPEKRALRGSAPVPLPEPPLTNAVANAPIAACVAVSPAPIARDEGGLTVLALGRTRILRGGG